LVAPLFASSAYTVLLPVVTYMTPRETSGVASIATGGPRFFFHATLKPPTLEASIAVSGLYRCPARFLPYTSHEFASASAF